MDEYWTIKQFSKMTGATIRTLQYYDEQQILSPHHKSEAGYRFYSSNELACFQKIEVLKYIGFNLNQIKTVILSQKLDLLSSLNLQAKVIKENITHQLSSLKLVQHAIEAYQAENELDWKIMVSILDGLKMSHSTDYKEWTERNFSSDEVNAFIEVSTNINESVWMKLFAEAKKLMAKKSVSTPEAHLLALKWIDTSKTDYHSNSKLSEKIWELMKVGDIPSGLIPGYEKKMVLFMNSVIEDMVKSNYWSKKP